MGFSTPVVIGKVIGRFFKLRTARYAKAWASIASLDQPKVSAKTIPHGRRSASSRIKVLLRAPPPHTIATEGLDGKNGSTPARLAAVNAVSVAAASSVARLSTGPVSYTHLTLPTKA